MKVIKAGAKIPADVQGAFITVGNFDGVHLGHRQILQKLIREAARAGRKALLVTFDPHPKMILHPERRPFYLLTTLEEKLILLEELGLDAVILISFSLGYAGTTAESFVVDFLWRDLQVRKLFIGHDYKFGRKKEGNADVLAAYGKQLGFEVCVIDAVSAGDSIVSSTKIREAILAGGVETAAALLGRPYNVSGPVVKGQGRGASLGFPTANIKPEKELLPARGVYAAMVKLEGASYRAVLNIGINPTFGESSLTLEVHLLDFHSDLYGKVLDVQFIKRLREERKFSGPEELIGEMIKDREAAQVILAPLSA